MTGLPVDQVTQLDAAEETESAFQTTIRAVGIMGLLVSLAIAAAARIGGAPFVVTAGAIAGMGWSVTAIEVANGRRGVAFLVGLAALVCTLMAIAFQVVVVS